MLKLTAVFLFSALFFTLSCKRKLFFVDKQIFESRLIEASLLKQIISHSSLKIIDLRPPKEYKLNHLPGAISITRKDMENLTHPVKGMMATKIQMQQLLSKIGIKKDDFVVIYDCKGNPDAARFFWILEVYGHPHKALLNGGYKAWKKVKGEINKQVVHFPKSTYRFEDGTKNTLIASLQEVKKALNDTNYCIIDTRSLSEYTGKEQKENACRTGHIPSSLHIDYEDNIDKKNCKFKSLALLKHCYSRIPKNKKIIVYCQSGVRSSLSLYVLRDLLNYPKVSNYDGSWNEWSCINELPITSSN